MALRDHPSVAPNTATKVKDLAERVGFRPRRHRNTSICAGLRTHTLVLLLCQRPMELLSVPLNAALVQALEANCRAQDLQLSIVHCDGEAALPRWLTPARVDGTLVLGPAPLRQRAQIQELRPVLLLASSLGGEEPWADCVSFDYRQRGRLAARYLLDKGHDRIGFLSPTPDHAGWNTVARSFQKFAQAKGVEPFMMISERGYEGAVWHSFEHQPIVADLIDRWQREPAASRPTGIYVVKDEITQVVYQELEARQIKVGRDVEILSTDNIAAVLSSLQPRPATLDLNVEELASRALDKMFYRINNPDADFGTVSWVPAKLVNGDGRSQWRETSVENEQDSL